MNNVTYDKYLMSLRKWRNQKIIEILLQDCNHEKELSLLEEVVEDLKRYERYLEYQRWSKQLARNDIS